MNKRKYKGTNITVTECLTSLRIATLKDVTAEFGFNKVWISDGVLTVMDEGSVKPKMLNG